MHRNPRSTSARTANVTRERRFLHTAMNSRFFEGLERRRLRVSETRFGAALRKNPPSTSSSHKKKLNRSIAHPVTHGGHLLRSHKSAKLPQRDKPRECKALLRL